MPSIQLQIANLAQRVRSGFGLPPKSSDDCTVKFMILGIEKAGTTWLATTLNQIPGIARSKPKETRFFNALWNPSHAKLSDHRVRSIYIRKHWPNVSVGNMLFEASPGYLASAEACERISKYYPDLRCVALLRNPTARLFSKYNMLVRNKGLQISFRNFFAPLLAHAEAFEHLQKDDLNFYNSIMQGRFQREIAYGLYYYHFKIWFAKFSKDQFLILTTKQLNDKGAYGDLLEFIGVDRKLIRHVPFDHEARDKHGGAPIDPEDAARLEAFYAPYNAKLFRLLNVSRLDW